MLAERDVDRALDLYRELLDGIQVDHQILTITHPEGREVLVDVCAFPMEVDGHLAGLWGVAADVTEAERQRRALTESEELLLQLTDNISEVFYLATVDLDRLFFVSPAYEDLWGRSIADLYKEPRSRFTAVHAEDVVRVTRAILQRLPEAPFDLEYRVTRPDGSYRWVQERGFPVPGDDGEVVRVAGTITDITERKLLEEQLLHSQKMDSIGRLAGGIAHDFNNLLMVVLNSASFLKEAVGSDQDALHDLQRITEAGERGAHLVRQLLTYSRKQIVSPRKVVVNDLLEDITEMLERTIGEDVTLVCDLADDLTESFIDPNQFVQVMLNLAVNARDAMPGGGTLGIETRNVVVSDDFPGFQSARPGAYVCVAVSDTGSGMSKGVSKQVFEPFFTTKPKAEATGLGLSTVYGIVTQAGGHVGVYSEPGVGTTFKVYLPISSDRHVGTGDRSLRSRSGRGETVLVAEDDEAIRTLTSKILQRTGYRVLNAATGTHALECCEAHSGRIHVLLADVVMPGMSGRELASHIKVRRPDTEILYMSGYTANMIGRHGILSSEENYIQKPFTSEELLRKLDQILDRA